LLEHRLFHGLKDWRRGDEWQKPDWRIVVADASAPIRAARLWRVHLPVIGEISALSRAFSTLYSQTVMPRLSELLRADKNGTRERVVVSISSAREWEDGEIPIYGTLMRESLPLHCSAIPTTLGRISDNNALLLLMHAYQNAWGA
jgi:hypothetical protein